MNIRYLAPVVLLSLCSTFARGAEASLMAIVANTPLFAGSYDLKTRAFNTDDPLPPRGWNPKCLYIEIKPSIAEKWGVEVKLGQNWSYIVIEHGDDGFFVASFDRTLIVD